MGLVLHTLAPSVSQSDSVLKNTPPEATEYATKPACDENDVLCLIYKYSAKYGVNTDIALRIAFCESSFDPYARNPNSSASGIYQITRATFLEGAKRRGLNWTWHEVMDVHKNIDMAMWFMSIGEIHRWNASKHCLYEH